jgi:prepilin-type N-terminal cleavage/methylation domain-containing protein
MKRTQNIKGFTIIEVVLVLAIAGLIFLMVFIALPALQAGQRDTARKSDVSAVAAAMNSFASNNKGTFPNSTELVKQLGGTVSGSTQTLAGVSKNTSKLSVTSTTITSSTTVTAVDGTVSVYVGRKCGAVSTAGSVVTTPGSARQYAVVTMLEGGSKSGYCLEG